MIGSIKDVIENKAVRHIDEFGVDEERSLITFEANDFQVILNLAIEVGFNRGKIRGILDDGESE